MRRCFGGCRRTAMLGSRAVGLQFSVRLAAIASGKVPDFGVTQRVISQHAATVLGNLIDYGPVWGEVQLVV